ncbi:MAG: hypothetical protein RML45_15295 [Acetobacteraceae bacterium]|nr:hypothetical protein [Acetobacteraceae bacterium]
MPAPGRLARGTCRCPHPSPVPDGFRAHGRPRRRPQPWPISASRPRSRCIIGSVSLLADSIDFPRGRLGQPADLGSRPGWSAAETGRGSGTLLALLLLVPTVAALWMAWQKILEPLPPSAPLPLSLAGAGALLVNVTCALMLARFRTRVGGR